MATTTSDDAFHEIQLNGKQLVFLFMAAVVVSVVIFLCGVLVGRGVRAERAPVDALAQPAATGTVAGAAISAPPSSGAPATANENLSYPNRLGGGQPPVEKLRAAEPAPIAAVPTPRTDAPAEGAEDAGRAEGAGSAAAAAPSVPPALSSEATGFAIQVAALSQRAEAESVARGLSTKGYPAYVMDPDAGAPAVFRVRVGKFKDRREAESIAARLQKEEQFKPWIVR
jgi:cell division septation protein DedD